MEKTIKLGLNLLLFLAAIVAIGGGTLVGMFGVWGALAWGKPVPEWEKLGHAHAAWWSVLIILASILLPSVNLKLWVKKVIIAGTFVGPVLWVSVLAAYYEIGGPRLWRFEEIFGPGSYYELPLLGVIAGFLEILGFIALLIIVLSALGIKLPFLYSEKIERTKYDLISDVEIPRKIFLVPLIVFISGVMVGFFMTTTFKVLKQPIDPAALVQFHDHLAIISTSAVILLIILKIFNVNEKVFNISNRLVQFSLPLILIGFLIFILGKTSSLAWVIPSGIYYLIFPIAFLTVLGFFREKELKNFSIYSLKYSFAVAIGILMFLIAIGPYIALTWDTNPNITVTYKQPAGEEYPGPYPKEYNGTAPVKGTPRGLENAHLSPGSWFHVALVWLIILTIFGNQMFEGIIKKPGLIYLLAITIPMAPIFNALGRFLAWLGIPNGVGALYFAGHPIKGFNIILLFFIILIMIIIIYKTKK